MDKQLSQEDRLKFPLRVIDLFAGVGGFRLGLSGGPGMPDRLHHRYYKIVYVILQKNHLLWRYHYQGDIFLVAF